MGRGKDTKTLVPIRRRVTRRDNEDDFAIRHGRLLLGALRPPSTPRCQGDSRRRREVFRRLVCRRRRVVTRSPRAETERYYRVCACARVCAVVPRACRRRRSHLYRWTCTAGRYPSDVARKYQYALRSRPCRVPSVRAIARNPSFARPTGDGRDLLKRGRGAKKIKTTKLSMLFCCFSHSSAFLVDFSRRFDSAASVVSKGPRVYGFRVINILYVIMSMSITLRQSTLPIEIDGVETLEKINRRHG